MVTKPQFQDMVANAYQSLYDFVHLRNHPLTQLILPDSLLDHKERGWQLHHTLLETVEELYPGPDAPPFSREWRRHRLMVLRYVEAMEPQAVADQLSISRRQYYREHAVAIEAVTDILWEQIDHGTADSQPPTANHSTAMQLEFARISQNDAYADLGEVIEGVLAILEKVLNQNHIEVHLSLPDETPITSIGHNMLRQIMLGILGFLVEQIGQTTIALTASPDDLAIHLRIATIPPDVFDEVQAHTQLATFHEMLRLGNGDMALLRDNRQVPYGFDLDLPVEYDCTVLAVDDNEDTLALYKRCLTPNHYRVITTKTAHSVLHLARESRPDIIVLDLMMPEQDGWDLLQMLSNQPDTAHIPIMICSVLKQKQLALSLGAAAFLEKPFTEQILLKTLDQLRKGL